EVDLHGLMAGRKVALIGLPGAFTPTCTRAHIPDLVEAAPQLAASGFQAIVCVAPNSPWVVAAWAERTDPDRRLTFLSDGNLELTRALGLSRKAPEFFLGECSARYSLIVRDLAILRVSVEERLEDLSCTRGAAFV